jgi:hypothetical protein
MRAKYFRKTRLAGALPLALLIGGCSLDIGATGFVNDKVSTAAITTRQPILLPDGTCEADATLFPTGGRSGAVEIALGINECDLVRLKAARPDDVLIGQGGTGLRETQVLYAEPGGRELYLFTDNKLTKIVKPGQG